MSAATSEPASRTAPQQYLTFTLGQEEFGVEILQIQEIKGYSPLTPLPTAPACVRGVLNLRGTIVPILDLRAKFGLPPVAATPVTVIVVVQVQGKTTGFLVDAVSDVLTVDGAQVQPAPDCHGQLDTTGLAGIAQSGGKLVTLLDLDRLLGAPGASAGAQATVN